MLQDQIAELFERKEQLKEDVTSTQEQVDQWKTKYRCEAIGVFLQLSVCSIMPT